MALKPTIYKARISISDLNDDYYDSLNLTIALHPSETLERMTARLLALCLNAKQAPVFTKGLSEVSEPDIWCKSLDDQIQLWIDIGEPDHERIKKATRQAKQVKVYTFNSKSDVWWQQSENKYAALAAEVIQFPWESIVDVTQLIDRSIDMSLTITGQSAYITTEKGEAELTWRQLK